MTLEAATRIDDPHLHAQAHEDQRASLIARGHDLPADIADLLDDPETHYEVHLADREAFAAVPSALSDTEIAALGALL